MALKVSYSPQFLDELEAILNFFDERNGSPHFSKKLLKMPEIGRQTDFPGVRILFVERYGIVYQIRDKAVLIVNIYSCETNPNDRLF